MTTQQSEDEQRAPHPSWGAALCCVLGSWLASRATARAWAVGRTPPGTRTRTMKRWGWLWGHTPWVFSE